VRAARPGFVALCATLALGVQPASASAPGAEGHASLESTVRYMQESQNSDGGFGEGGESNPDFSAWVALALASVGVNPQDQAKPGGVSVFTYLSEHAGEPSAEAALTTTTERELLVVDAAGTSPRDFGGVDLVQKILERELPDGSFSHVAGGPGTINDTIFAILSLSLVQEAAAEEAVQKAAGWLLAEQEPDHGWPVACPRSQPACGPEESSVEMTGAALEALRAAGRVETPAQLSALEYLQAAQDADGGFAEQPRAAESNVDSTAWVVQGVVASGRNPEEWVRNGNNPLSYMESLQQPDGHIRLEQHADQFPLFDTAYVTAALALRAYPIPPVPRSPSQPAAQSGGEAGQGGESPQVGSGVIAGGGGAGAKLFSRPQPQSQGHARGGMRVLASKSRHAATVKHAHSVAASARHLTPARRPSASKRPIKQRPNTLSEPAPTGAPASTEGTGHGEGGAGGGGEPEVSGLLLASSRSAAGATGRAAPGLRGAGAGDGGQAWPALAISILIALLGVAGSQLERRRPQVVL